MTADHSALASKVTFGRTLIGGLAGFLGFVTGLYFTFAQFGGSRRGQTGLLFNPETQSHKLIAVWKEIEPLPRLVVDPLPMFAGYLVFTIGWAFLFRSIRSAWPQGVWSRGGRLALLIWSFTAFFELQGPVNLFHVSPLPLAIALTFWGAAASAAAFAIAYVVEGTRRQPPPGGEDVRRPEDDGTAVKGVQHLGSGRIHVDTTSGPPPPDRAGSQVRSDSPSSSLWRTTTSDVSSVNAFGAAKS
jgi:hypothetical protein